MFTCSETSVLREACTPIKNGVGVDKTSTKPAGNNGIYTWLYLNGYIRDIRAEQPSVSLV